MENAIPPGLVEQVPQLVVMVLVVGAILAFMWKLWQSQSGLVKEIVSRHEGMEKEQMAVLDRNNEVIRQKVEVLRHLDSTIGDFGGEIRRLAEKIDPPYMREAMSHSIASPSAEPHLGIPGGVFEPAVEYNLKGLQQTGETSAWTIQRYGIDKLHDQGIKGAGAQVVVIDTGIDRNHPDLAPNFTMGVSAIPGETFADGNGHGSHCAGIVAADDNGTGIVGVAPDAKVYVVKGLSNAGSGTGDQLASAIRHAADLSGHRILSCSFGASGEDARITAAVRYAISKGHWLFAAAGNSGPGSINWPGALEEVVCVAALDNQDRVAGFSSANRFVDVGFGGVQILSTIPGGRWARYDGTSMSTPGVAGVAALAVGELLEAGRPIPPQSVMMEALYATCRDIGTPGRDNGAGYGLVQPAEFVAEMVKRAGGGVKPDPKPEPKPFTVSVAKLKADGYTSLVVEL